jgi:single-strand DNA-binding protein
MVGRLTRDPELRFTTKGAAVCRFDLAVNRRYKDTTGEWKDDTSFIPVVVWREAAQRCGERLKKGSPVYVEGRLKSKTWETKEGQKRSGIEVESLRVQFLEKMGESAASEESEAEPAAVLGSSSESTATAPAEEEIPF